MPEKLSYEDSCRFLQSKQLIDKGDIPPLPKRPPRYDDEILGVNFFRTLVADEALENLTLPKTFFSRSEISHVSFQGSDLSESTINWNDFRDVNFSSCNLSNCDFRGCVFENTRFVDARLAGADFRHSSFTNCNFIGADLEGAKLTKESAASLDLSPDQRHLIAWQADDGDEPDGG